MDKVSWSAIYEQIGDEGDLDMIGDDDIPDWSTDEGMELLESLPETVKENDVFMHALCDSRRRHVFHLSISFCNTDKYYTRWHVYRDHFTWQHRTNQMDKNWELLIHQLTNYYLCWKYPINAPEAMEDVEDKNHIEFEIKVVDIHTTPQSATI